MCQLVAQKLAEQIGSPGLIVDVPDEGVLDRDPASGPGRVFERGIEHLGHLPALIDGH